MPVNVVATMKVKEGQQDAVLAAIAEAAPHFHDDPGCRLYAPQRSGRSRVVLIESYSDQDALKAHAESSAFKELQEKLADLVEGPSDITLCTPVPAGDETKGAL